MGRVIARPFLGHTADTFYRTTNRHDLSLKPPRATMLDLLKDAGGDVIAVGKIFDIFDGEGVTEKIKTTGNIQWHRLYQGPCRPATLRALPL